VDGDLPVDEVTARLVEAIDQSAQGAAGST